MKQVRFGPYEVLANAIIITAAEDFRNGIKILRRHLGKRPQDVKSDKYKDWFEDKKKITGTFVTLRGSFTPDGSEYCHRRMER